MAHWMEELPTLLDCCVLLIFLGKIDFFDQRVTPSLILFINGGYHLNPTFQVPHPRNSLPLARGQIDNILRRLT